MNSGKTLVMSNHGLEEFAKGKTIYSNYYVAYPHKLINRDYLLHLGETQPVLENACFLLDELWIWLDCREAQMNKVATYFFLQSSKDDTMIYMTAQDDGQNELRIRRNKHKMTTCRRVVKKEGEYQSILNNERFLTPKNGFPAWVIDNLYIECTNWEQQIIGMKSEMRYINTTYLKAKPLFQMYNTAQKIKKKQI